MEKNFIWSKDLTLQLLCLYETNENLYVVKHPDYINRIKRADSFQMIVDSLKCTAPNITIETVKRKIHSLRNQFTRDLREVERSKKSGAGAEDIFEPKLWCYNEMLFLRIHCKTRDSTSSYEEKIEQPNEEAIYESLIEEDEIITPKRKAKSSVESLSKRLKTISGSFEEKMSHKSPYAWLGKQVVFEIEQMVDEKLKRKAAWEIQKILRDFGEEDLSKSSHSDSLPSTSHESREENLRMNRQSSTKKWRSSSTSGEVRTNANLVHVLSVEQIRPASASSDVARSSFTSDILEQSMEGVFDENDFY